MNVPEPVVLTRWLDDDTREWFTATGRRRVARWNNNTGRYEPDPDNH